MSFKTDERFFFARHLGETVALAFDDATPAELELPPGAWLLHFGGTIPGTVWVRQGGVAAAAAPSTPFAEGGITSFETVVRFPPRGSGTQYRGGQTVSVLGDTGVSGTLYATRISRGGPD